MAFLVMLGQVPVRKAGRTDECNAPAWVLSSIAVDLARGPHLSQVDFTFLLWLLAIKLPYLHKHMLIAWLHLEHNLHSVNISTCFPETQSSQERKFFMEEGG